MTLVGGEKNEGIPLLKCKEKNRVTHTNDNVMK